MGSIHGDWSSTEFAPWLPAIPLLARFRNDGTKYQYSNDMHSRETKRHGKTCKLTLVRGYEFRIAKVLSFNLLSLWVSRRRWQRVNMLSSTLYPAKRNQHYSTLEFLKRENEWKDAQCTEFENATSIELPILHQLTNWCCTLAAFAQIIDLQIIDPDGNLEAKKKNTPNWNNHKGHAWFIAPTIYQSNEHWTYLNL